MESSDRRDDDVHVPDDIYKLFDIFEKGDLSRFQLLRHQGVPFHKYLDITDGTGCTMPMLAAMCENQPQLLVELLDLSASDLNYRFDVNYCGMYNWPVLNWVIFRGYTQCIAPLFDLGATLEVDGSDIGENTLHIAARSSVNTLNSNTLNTLLTDLYNCRETRPHLLSTTADAINNPDNYGHTPLMHAVAFSTARTVECLLTSPVTAGKVDVNCANQYGWTPLHWAAHVGNDAVLKLLLDHKADPTLVTRDQGLNHVEKPSSTEFNNRGDNALHLAVRSKSVECVRLIVEGFQGDDTDSRTKLLFAKNAEGQCPRDILEADEDEVCDRTREALIILLQLTHTD